VCPFHVKHCGSLVSRQNLTGNETSPLSINITGLPAGEVCLIKVYSKCGGPSVSINGNVSSSLTFERLDMEDADEVNSTLAQTGRALKSEKDKDKNTPNSTEAKKANGTATNKPRDTKVKNSDSKNNTHSSEDVIKQVCTLAAVKNKECSKFNKG
jgi:hypothetical protein